MTESKSGIPSNLQRAQNIIWAYWGHAFLGAVYGEGDYAEFKDRTVAELHEAITDSIACGIEDEVMEEAKAQGEIM